MASNHTPTRFRSSTSRHAQQGIPQACPQVLTHWIRIYDEHDFFTRALSIQEFPDRRTAGPRRRSSNSTSLLPLLGAKLIHTQDHWSSHSQLRPRGPRSSSGAGRRRSGTRSKNQADGPAPGSRQRDRTELRRRHADASSIRLRIITSRNQRTQCSPSNRHSLPADQDLHRTM